MENSSFGYMINPAFTKAYNDVKTANYQLEHLNKNTTDSEMKSLLNKRKIACNIFENTEAYKKKTSPQKNKFAIMDDARKMNKEIGGTHKGLNLIA